MNKLSYKDQITYLTKLTQNTTLSPGDQTVWTLTKSRTGFIRPTLVPPPKCIPISNKNALDKLITQKAQYNAPAPTKFIADLQKQLIHAKGKKAKKALLKGLEFWRVYHIRHRRDNLSLSSVPPLSKQEKEGFLETTPRFLKAIEALPKSFFHRKTYASVTKTNPTLTELPAPPKYPSDSKRKDCFEFTTTSTALPLPQTTLQRHKQGKRRIVRSTRFTSSEYVFQ